MTPVTVAPSNSNWNRTSRPSDGQSPYAAYQLASMTSVTSLRNASDTANDGNSSRRHRAFAASHSPSSVWGRSPFSYSSTRAWTRCPTHAW